MRHGRQARDRPRGALAAAARARSALLALVAVVGEAAAQAGAAIDHWRHRPPLDPLALVLELADGRSPLAAGRHAAADRDAARASCSLIAIAAVCACGGRPHAAPIVRRGCWAPAAAPSGVARERAGRRPSGSASSSPGCRSRARSRAARRCTRAGRTCSATSGVHAKARPARGRSRRCWRRRARRSRPRTSPTCTPPPGRCASGTGEMWNFDPEQIAGGRAGLVVEPAQLRHLGSPGARADRRVRGRLPRPGRAA